MGRPRKAGPRRARKTGESAGGANRRIEQYAHKGQQRKNNPPVGLVIEATDRDAPRKRYAYDPHLDPTLTWAGKAEHLSFDVPTVSLHVSGGGHAGQAAADDRCLRLLRARPSRRGRRQWLRLQDGAARHTQEHREQRAARSGDALRPAEDRQQPRARHRTVHGRGRARSYGSPRYRRRRAATGRRLRRALGRDAASGRVAGGVAQDGHPREEQPDDPVQPRGAAGRDAVAPRGRGEPAQRARRRTG